MKKRIIFASSALLILAIEVIIALYVHDSIIRPYGGDVLAVLFVWCAARSAVPTKFRFMWLFVLLVAFIVEFSQYIGLVSILKLENNRFFTTLLGTTFSWKDILCYIIGIVPAALHDLTQKRLTGNVKTERKP